MPLSPQRRFPAALARAAALPLALASGMAHASFFKGEALDRVADIMAVVVLVVVPIVAVVVFWLVHILPEKIAEKRRHPQLEAIKTLCLLSLVFGGMLWPFAWLWAYTRPVMHRMAYGTDLHEEYFLEQGEKAKAGTLLRDELAFVRTELEAMEARGALPPKLAKLRDDLNDLAAQYRAEQAADAPKPGGGA